MRGPTFSKLLQSAATAIVAISLSGCMAWPAFTAALGAGGASAGGGLEGLALLAGDSASGGSDGGSSSPASISRIEIGGSHFDVMKNGEIELSATAIYSNNTNSEVSDRATWQSLDEERLAPLGEGRFRGQSLGEVEIEVEFEDHTARQTIVVREAHLTRIEIDPPSASLSSGHTVDFRATAIYEDASSRDITDESTLTFSWNSSGLGTINQGGTKGRVRANSEGESEILAHYNPDGTNELTATATIVVTKAVLESITLTPANQSIALGLKAELSATGHFSDGSSSNITSDVEWQIEPADHLAATATAGHFQTLAETTTPLTLRATLSGISSDDVSLEITQKLLESISIEPTSASRPLGHAATFTASGTFTDGTTADVTDEVTWSSSNETVATIQNSGQPGRAESHAVGTTTITASYGGTEEQPFVSVSASFEVTAAILESISITPATPVVRVGETMLLYAIGHYSDSTSANLSELITWQSLNTEVATISNSSTNRGRVTPDQAVATTSFATIHASYSSHEATIELRVEPDTTPPVVTVVSSISPTRIRITYSKPVNGSEARNVAHYRIADAAALSGSCSDNSNFSSTPATSDFVIESISGSGALYEIVLSDSQHFGKNYSVIVDRTKLHDTSATANPLGCSNRGNFEGLAQLRVTSASCSDLQSVVLRFSKPVLAGDPDHYSGSAECFSAEQCAEQYQLSGGDLGEIVRVRRLDGTICNGAARDDAAVCLEHTLLQSGSIYTLRAPANTSDATQSETIQPNPRDRANFSGCGTMPSHFSEGAVSSDTFGDGSSFGFLTFFANRLYLGPNQLGNAAARFSATASDPESIDFTFERRGSMRNSASSRDGGIAVPPYVSIGHTGCSVDSADLSNGCGPDNENGRGVFTAGTLDGREFLFLGGSRNFTGVTFPEFNYLYYTEDTGNLLNFRWIFLGNITGSSTAGTQSLQTFHDRLYAGFAKLNERSDGGGGVSRNTPDFGVVRFATSETIQSCAAGSNCDASASSRGLRFRIDRVPHFGGSSADSNDNRFTNFGLYAGVDSITTFNDRIYAANGGHHRRNHNGGIIRSASSNPGACSSKYNCESNWIEITPRSHPHWHGSGSNLNRWFSLELRRAYDFTPADHAFAGFAEFHGRLYATRNICITDESSVASTAAGHHEALQLPARPGCHNGNFTHRRAQLWVCDPDDDGHCSSESWSVVADDGTGFTNFGNMNNHSLTMIAKSGSYLYVGFDNAADGVEFYRTALTHPGAESHHWEKIAPSGLTDASSLQSIFSAVSVESSNHLHFLYISVGRDGVPLRIFRQQNL